jgi:hypothetical protein
MLTWILQRLWDAFFERRRAAFLIHRAYFASTGKVCYFLNLTNRSSKRDLEVTHVWFALEPEVHADPPDRPLPKRLKPDETWETWVEADRLPADIDEQLFQLGRARLSTGRILKSRKNKDVPSQGAVPGGPIHNLRGEV